MKRFALAAAFVAVLAIPCVANAQVFSAPGVGGFGPIADGTGSGVAGATTTSTATIAGSGIITDVTVDFGLGGLTHSFVGDLTIVLTHPNGVNSIFLQNRPGRGTASTFGFGSDYAIGNSYAFKDGSTDVFAGAGPAATIPSGVFNTSSNPNPPATNLLPWAYAATSLNAAFGGLDSAGVWTMTINDWAATDTGTLNGWTLTLNTVPEPTSMTLCGIAVAGFGWKKWRRRKA